MVPPPLASPCADCCVPGPIPVLQLLSDLGVGEQREQPRSANYIANQRGSDEVTQSARKPNLPGKQQQKGLGATGDDMGEVAESDDISQRQHDPEFGIVNCGTDPGNGSDDKSRRNRLGQHL
jgi:hypothetical protein